MMFDMKPLDDRFWAKVEVTGFCWNWTASTKAGYGQFGIKGRNVRAHRAAYESLVGPIPDGLVLDHLCRNRACVNPDHLEPVTQAENKRRGYAPPAENGRKGKCSNGHAFSRENTRTTQRGWRYCRTCDRERKRAQHRRIGRDD